MSIRNARSIVAGTGAVLLWSALGVLALGGTAAADLGTTLLTTTTTLVANPAGVIDGLVGGDDGDATTTTSTTTVVEETTTTTTPDSDTGSGSSSDAGDTGTRTGSENGAGQVESTPGHGPANPVAIGHGAPGGPALPAAVPAGASSAGRIIDDVTGRANNPKAAAPAVETPAATPLVGKGLPPFFAGRSTSPVLSKLAGLDLTPTFLARVLAPFPVAGQATYSADFGAPRHVPAPHAHEGTDIFAASGTPVIASADGVVSRMVVENPVSGTALRLTGKGGTYFFYAHLDGFAPGLKDGEEVAKGDVLGFVGTSGNAEGTSPHLHYEIHPMGGDAVDPVPYLDQWIADATLSADSVSVGNTLALGPGVKSGAGRAARTAPRAPAMATPAVTDIGNVQTISYSAVAPATVLLLAGGASLLVKRLRRRAQRTAR